MEYNSVFLEDFDPIKEEPLAEEKFEVDPLQEYTVNDFYTNIPSLLSFKEELECEFEAVDENSNSVIKDEAIDIHTDSNQESMQEQLTFRYFSGCSACGKEFNCKYLETNASGCYICRKCTKQFNLKHLRVALTKVSLQSHVSKKVNNKLRYSCNECGKKFSSQSRLMSHVMPVHRNLKNFVCNLCDMKFGYKSHLDRHSMIVHRGVKAFNCNLCKKKFGLKNNLRVHMKTIHEKVKEFVCRKCGHEFSQKSNLVAHTKIIHEGLSLRPFDCEFCGKKFTRMGHLNAHLKAIHNKVSGFTERKR